MNSVIHYSYMDSPLGRILLAADGPHLICLYMTPHKGNYGPQPGWVEAAEPLKEVRRQLSEYFAGERREFDLPLKAEGTPFQRRVWQELMRIPYGETISYGELARRVGQPAAARAVGSANGRNPISIVVPCHRVIGASGKLTGYGGGLPRKVWLLEHERDASGLFGVDQSAPPALKRSPSMAARSGKS